MDSQISPNVVKPEDFTFFEKVDPAEVMLKPGILILLMILAVWIYASSKAQKGISGPSGGLNYVVGPMGSGKSMFGVRTIIAALCRGQYVITNVRLLPGWEKVVAKKNFSKSRRERAERMLLGLYVYEPSLRTAMRYRVPCAKCGEDTRVCGHSGPYQEGRAIFVWDETHNDLNNRDYQGHGKESNERALERERRRLVIRWATQLRKLGFIGYLLSQHHENTDAQLRRVCNHIIMLQNQRNRGGFGALLPRRLAMFLVFWYPAHLADGTTKAPPVRFERYFLPWTAKLYDSWETFHGIDDGLDDETTPILLPKGGRRAGATAPERIEAEVSAA